MAINTLADIAAPPTPSATGPSAWPNDPNFAFLATGVGAVGGGAGGFGLGTLMNAVAKFYRRCGAAEALVRTGSGGNKVVIGGGIIVMPVLHQLSRVSLRSVKLSVERASKNALVTADKIKANVETELYVKVEPLA